MLHHVQGRLVQGVAQQEAFCSEVRQFTGAARINISFPFHQNHREWIVAMTPDNTKLIFPPGNCFGVNTDG